MAGAGALRMLTFAPTIDSETARLTCRWYGVDYVEEDHLFGWVSLLSLVKGGNGALPLLYGGRRAINGSRQVIAHFDPVAPPERRLIPNGLESVAVDADWSAYNVRLGHEIAVLAYFHLLPMTNLMVPVFAGPVPPGEARLTPKVYPVLRQLFTTLLQLRPERAQAAERRIIDVFAATDRRLADGRRFLRGERLTAGDLAFAGAAAPLLQPPGNGAQMPEVDAMPPALRQTIDHLRMHRTAGYVESVYDAVLGT